MAQLSEFVASVFSADGFVPRRICGSWPVWLVWEHVIGNALIWLAYVMIPFVLWRLGVRRSRSFRFLGLMRVFAWFVALCGLGHFLDMVAFFRPMYRLSGHVLVATGLVSWWALFTLRRAWPALMSQKGPIELEAEVTARTRELDAALAQFHALVECIPQIVWTARPDGYLDYYNRRWYEFSGQPRGEGGDQSWKPILHPDDRPRCKDAWYAAVRAGHPYEIEYRFQERATGNYRWFLGRAVPLHDESGRIVKWLGTATDIDDQKQAQESLRRSEADLEAKVRERTAELAAANASLQAEIAERRRSETRQAIQGAVSAVLAEAGSLEETIPRILEAIGEGFGLDLGEYWRRDAASGRMLCGGSWSVAGGPGEAFIAGSEAYRSAEGLGLPGRIWAYERPSWVEDLGQEPDFVRAELAARLGIRGGFGFPVRTETGPAGVFMFFSRAKLPPDAPMLDALSIIGHQVGLFIERRHADEALHQSEEQFRGAFDAAAFGMALVAPNGRFLKVNRSVCEILGYTEAELLVTDFQAITHPDDLEADLDLVRQMLTGEIRSYHMEKRYIHKEGRVVWGKLSVSLVRDASGQPLHFVSQIIDITPRKLAEEARRLSESTIRSLFDSAPLSMGIVEVHEDDIFHVSCNAAMAASMGQDASQIQGRFVRELGAPEPVRLEWLRRYRECLRDNHPVRFEYGRPAAGNAEERWVSATVCPIGSATGPWPRCAYVAEDITERKANELAKSRLTAILEATSDLVGVADAEGRVLYVNRAGKELLGLNAETDLEGFRSKDVYPTWALEKIRENALPAASRDGVWRGETAFLSRNGREIPTSQVIIVHRSAQGEIDYISTVARDITEQRLTEQELRRARDQALAATTAKSNFLANMSHEIRTPMNGIMGMAELLLDTQLDEQQHDYAATIRSSADAMLTIVNDILDLSKIEAGKFSIEAIVFNLRELIEEVADLMAPSAHQKGLQLSCLVAPDLPDALVGDPTRLRQILTNLVGNAVKFTERGEISVDARAVDVNAGDVSLRISVRDTGIGIPVEKRAMIFDSFTQADDGTTRRYGGTGLGLTICRQLARLMGGTIDLESELKAGSTFWLDVTLPRGPSVERVHLPLPQKTAGLRVLVADANATNRDVVREYLRSFGCRADEAGTAGEALEVLRTAAGERPVDLIFVDARMPEMDGERFARMIRGENGLAKTPLVLMSPNSSAISDLAMIPSLFAARVSKPIRRSQLLNAIGDVLESRALAEPAPAVTSRPSEPVAGGLGLRVLVADDYEINRRVAARMLESLGCYAKVVHDGRSAVEAIARDHYDAVLMDVQMPEMDGLAATAEIRKREHESGHRTPILAMTAHAMEGDRERCLAAGMDGYVAKPIRSKDLRDALVRWSSIPALGDASETSLPSATEDTFRWDTLIDRYGGDADFARTLVASVLDTTPATLREIRSALADRDAERVVIAAHGLKGNFLTIAAREISPALLEVERASRRGDLEAAAASFQRVESLWGPLSLQLQAGIESHS